MPAVHILLSFIFICLSIIHIYWGLGGNWGLESVIPRKEDDKREFRPGFIACILVAIAMLIAATIYIIPLERIDFLPAWFHYIYWFIPVIFFIRGIGDFKYAGIFKKIRNTKFAVADTKYFTPLCFLISALSLFAVYSMMPY